MSNRKNNKIHTIISGYYGFENIGDELALLSLSKFVLHNKTIVTSVNPDLTYSETGLKSVFSRCLLNYKSNYLERLRLFWKITRCKRLVFGGGTFLHDHGKGRLLEFILVVATVLIAKVCGRKVLAVGIGLGPLTTWYGKLFTKTFLWLSDGALLRDPFSFQLALKLCPAKPNKFVLGTDLAILMNTETVPHKTKHDKTLIGINLISHLDSADPGLVIAEVVIDTFTSLCEWLIKEKDAYIQFIPFQTKICDDNLLCKEIKKKVSQPERVIILDHINPKAIFDVFQKLDVFIGMRLHSIIVAETMGTPYIAIPYADKVEFFVNDVGRTSSLLPLKLMQKDLLIKKVKTLLEEGRQILPTANFKERTEATRWWIDQNLSF